MNELETKLESSEKLRKTLEGLYKLQSIVNELKNTGYAKYVESCQLSLIDSRFSEIDFLLEKGILIK